MKKRKYDGTWGVGAGQKEKLGSKAGEKGRVSAFIGYVGVRQAQAQTQTDTERE